MVYKLLQLCCFLIFTSPSLVSTEKLQEIAKTVYISTESCTSEAEECFQAGSFKATQGETLDLASFTRRSAVEAPINVPLSGSLPVGFAGPSSAPVVQNQSSSMALAADRTSRKDPLDGFKTYTGGWNIKDHHYWASVGYTAAPVFVVAAVWFLVFGLYQIATLVVHFCCGTRTFGYSRVVYLLSLILVIIFSVIAFIGCAVLYTGQGRFHRSTQETLDYVLDQADTTVNKLREVSVYLASAKVSGVDEVFVPSNIQTDIDQIGSEINSSASFVDTQTTTNAHDIRDLLDSVRVSLIVVAATMLVLVCLGFLFSIYGMQLLLIIIIVLGWLIVAGTFILCGTVLIVHNVAGDTCVAMNEWVQNPTAETVLGEILPCVDNATAQDTLVKSKEVSYQMVEVVNQVITNISNINFSPNFKSVYINQSGPLVPVLCNPFHADLTERSCSSGEVDLSNATEVWMNYVCHVSADGVCSTTGRLTPNFYSQMAAAVNVSSTLRNYAPFLIQLEDCTFVREAFAEIYVEYCPRVRRDSMYIYVGLVMLSTAVMLSIVAWIVFGRERRYRLQSERPPAKSTSTEQQRQRNRLVY